MSKQLINVDNFIEKSSRSIGNGIRQSEHDVENGTGTDVESLSVMDVFDDIRDDFALVQIFIHLLLHLRNGVNDGSVITSAEFTADCL